MKLELNIDCLPNQIEVNALEIIKTGFVFNTGYKCESNSIKFILVQTYIL
jgi:hypothetical protein